MSEVGEGVAIADVELEADELVAKFRAMCPYDRFFYGRVETSPLWGRLSPNWDFGGTAATGAMAGPFLLAMGNLRSRYPHVRFPEGTFAVG